jgi:hypothetical protein
LSLEADDENHRVWVRAGRGACTRQRFCHDCNFERGKGYSIKGVSDYDEWKCYSDGVEIMNMCIESVFMLPILPRTVEAVSQVMISKRRVRSGVWLLCKDISVHSTCFESCSSTRSRSCLASLLHADTHHVQAAPRVYHVP